MLRKPFLLLFFLWAIVHGTTTAQSWLWAKSVYGPNKDEILCIETDPWNNVYIGGRFRDTLRFTPTVNYVTSTTYFNGFIAKYDSSGTFLWARTFGGNHDDYTTALAVDDSGFVYAACYARSSNTVSFDGFSYMGTGNDKTFILKINPQGTALWGKLLTHGISNAYPSAIAVGGGIVAVAGDYSNVNMIIETDTLPVWVSSGANDIFLSAYQTSSGNRLWSKAIRSQYMDYAYELAVDNNGNVYTSGIHNGNLYFGTADSLMGTAGYEGFLSKHSPAGNYLWARRFRGTGDHMIDGLKIGPGGTIYIAGWHSSGNHTLNDTSFTMLYTYNFFLQKLSPLGSSLWTRHYHGNALGRIIGLDVDPFDNVFFSGYLGSQYNFDTIPLSGSSSNYKSFIAKVSGNGNLLHAISGGDYVNSGGYNNIATDQTGNAYTVGYFGTATAQTCTFGYSTLVSSGLSDGYIAKYGFPTPPPCLVSASFMATDTLLCIYDSVLFVSTSSNAVSQQWLVNGVITGTNTFLELHFALPGIYEVKLIVQGVNCQDSATKWIHVNMINDSHIYYTICQGDSVWFAQNYYSSAGTFFQVYPMPGPCDSVSYLHLTVKPTYHINIFDSICSGDTAWMGTNYYTSSGNYSITLMTMDGCDSVLNLSLVVHPKHHIVRYDTICSGDTTYLYNGTLAIYQSGIYTENLQTIYGCDSVTTLHVYVDTLVAAFIAAPNTATAVAGYATYQWLNCDAGYSPIAGATSNVFNVLIPGNYTVVISNQLCIDTADCQYIIVNKLDKISTEKDFTIFPNPAHDVLNVKIPAELQGEMAEIWSASGQLVYSFQMTDLQNTILLKDWNAGVYILRIKNSVNLRFVVY